MRQSIKKQAHMGVGKGGGGAEVSWPPWIFKHVTDKVEGGLMMLLFGLVFFSLLDLFSPSLGVFLPTLLEALL